MSEREEWLLPIIELEGGKLDGRTRLQKLSFLLDRSLLDRDLKSPFEFKQYKYGPFDEDIYHVMDSLREEGLVKEEVEQTPYGDRHVYKLTEKGEKKASEKLNTLGFWEKRTLNRLVSRWGDTPTQSIVGYVYDEYPEYTPN
ncbi:hypothetical protein JCM30237_12190 [Halolamina litorea]|uniref:Helix-turn-helix transcriptional regulator n=1 Tax=Halolamina litorea TaxID=1515593 RepID=A0ABD6BLS5_9EURY|nr:helix-turn-helix transcriptional regulator [Halolamina litorea]